MIALIFPFSSIRILFNFFFLLSFFALALDSNAFVRTPYFISVWVGRFSLLSVVFKLILLSGLNGMAFLLPFSSLFWWLHKIHELHLKYVLVEI